MSRFICSTGTRVFHAVNDTEAAERRPNALRRRRGVKVTSSLAGYHRWTATAATPMMSWSCAREARRRRRTKVWKHGQEQRSGVPEKNRYLLTRNNEQEKKTLPSSDHSPRIQESAPSYFVIFRWSIIVHIALRCLFSFLNTRRPSNKLFTVLTVRLFHPGWTPCWEPLCSRHVKLSLELEAISWCRPHISKANTEKKTSDWVSTTKLNSSTTTSTSRRFPAVTEPILQE